MADADGQFCGLSSPLLDSPLLIINDHVCMQTMAEIITLSRRRRRSSSQPGAVRGKFVGCKSSSPSHLIFARSLHFAITANKNV
jgi:hypothetical protein